MSSAEAQFSFLWTPDSRSLALAPWTPAESSSFGPGVVTGQLQRLGGDRLLVRFTASDATHCSAVVDWLEEWAAEDGWTLSYAEGLQDELPLRAGGPPLRCTSCRRFERPNWISALPVFGLWKRPRTLCRTCGIGHAMPVRSVESRFDCEAAIRGVSDDQTGRAEMAKRRKSEKTDLLCFVAKQWDDRRISYDELDPTATAAVHAPREAVFGSVALIASRHGQYVDAVGVVVGEPTHYKRARGSRNVFVTHRFPQSRVKLARPLGRRSHARVAKTVEFEDAVERAQESPTIAQFVLDTALRTDGATMTQESRCAGFLANCAEMLGFHADTECRVAGAQNSQGKEGVAAAKVDLIITVPPAEGRRRALVVETEWTHVGAAESAAQAFEYAARLRRSGWFDGGEHFDLSTAAVKKTELLPVVVANNVPDTRYVSKKLQVERQEYGTFLEMLSNRSFDRLTAIKLR